MQLMLPIRPIRPRQLLDRDESRTTINIEAAPSDSHASGLARKYGIAAMYAIHIANAMYAEAEDFVTTENKILYNEKCHEKQA